MSKELSIIVVNYGRSELLLNFLKSVRDSADLSFIGEVVIVDNMFPQKSNSRKVIDPRAFPFPILFVQNPQSSYASGVNRGVAGAAGDDFIISNNDIALLPNSSLRPLLNCLGKDLRIGVVGPQLVYPNGSWQRSYGEVPSFKDAIVSLTMLDSVWRSLVREAFRHNWLPKRSKRVGYIDGAFMAVRRSCFEELGGFNEEYSFYGEDADFCWRAWKNDWKVVFVPDARVMHVRGASSTADALGDYTVRLVKAKQKFIEECLGPRRAKWYRRLLQAAYFERMWLYSLVAWLTRSPHWQRRAGEMRTRCSALKGKS